MPNSMCLGVAKSLDYALPITHVDVLLLQVLICCVADLSLVVATNPSQNLPAPTPRSLHSLSPTSPTARDPQ